MDGETARYVVDTSSGEPELEVGSARRPRSPTDILDSDHKVQEHGALVSP